MNLAFALAIATCLPSCPPNDAGSVVVVGGGLKQIQFTVPGSVNCRLAYNTSRLSLYFDAGATQPAPPNTTFQSPQGQIAHGDMNLDGRVNGADIQKFVEVLLGHDTNPVLIAQADFDQNSVLNSNDTALFVSALLSGVTATSTVTLYSQGLSPSAGLCDTPVDILTDEDMNGTFVLAGTVETTVVALTLTPSSGPVGTPVTATISPAVTPLTFTAATTAAWSGVFQPMVGSPSTAFQIQYSAAQVREQSASQATLIVGDGAFVNSPDPAAFAGPGTMSGTVTIDFAGTSVAKPFSFSPEFDSATWEQVKYPDGPGGIDPPELDGEPTNLEIMQLSSSPSPTNPAEDMLLHANGFHVAAVVRIAENATTTANAPNTLLVDLISYNGGGTQIDRIDDVVLSRVASDGDPSHIVYHNDLLKPIVLVDVDLNNAAYPNVVPLYVVNGGTAVIVPASN